MGGSVMTKRLRSLLWNFMRAYTERRTITYHSSHQKQFQIIKSIKLESFKAKVSREEIKDVFFYMRPHKAPDPNGPPEAFLQTN